MTTVFVMKDASLSMTWKDSMNTARINGSKKFELKSMTAVRGPDGYMSIRISAGNGSEYDDIHINKAALDISVDCFQEGNILFEVTKIRRDRNNKGLGDSNVNIHSDK